MSLEVENISQHRLSADGKRLLERRLKVGHLTTSPEIRVLLTGFGVPLKVVLN
jgi:hypothetical protein